MQEGEKPQALLRYMHKRYTALNENGIKNRYVHILDFLVKISTSKKRFVRWVWLSETRGHKFIIVYSERMEKK